MYQRPVGEGAEALSKLNYETTWVESLLGFVIGVMNIHVCICFFMSRILRGYSVVELILSIMDIIAWLSGDHGVIPKLMLLH